MQSIISGRSAAALRTSSTRFSSRTAFSRTPLQARRNYAGEVKGEAKKEAEGNTTRLPLIVLAGGAVFIFAYYFSQGTIGTGNKAQGSGQATIKEIRREHGTENEYRDPRDSGVKTLGQKEGQSKGAGK